MRPAISVLLQNEVGALTSSFNKLIVELREITDAALAIAEGKLDVELGREGDLSDAFRSDFQAATASSNWLCA